MAKKKRTVRRKHRKRTKRKQYNFNPEDYFSNCKDIVTQVDKDYIKKCKDNYNYMDDEPIDEENPQNYYALQSEGEVEPFCITKQNYLSLPIKRGNPNGDVSNYYRENPFTRQQIRCNELSIPNNQLQMRNNMFYMTPNNILYEVYTFIRDIDKYPSLSYNNPDGKKCIDLILENNVNLNQNFFLKTYLRNLPKYEVEEKFKFLTLFQAIILFGRYDLLSELYTRYPHLNVNVYHMLLEQDDVSIFSNANVDIIESQTYYNILCFIYESPYLNPDQRIEILKKIKNNTPDYNFKILLDYQKIKIEVKTYIQKEKDIREKEEILKEIDVYKIPLEPIFKKYQRRLIAMRSGAQNDVNPDTGELYFPELTEDELNLKEVGELQIMPLQKKLDILINNVDYNISPKPLQILLFNNKGDKNKKQLISYMNKYNISTDIHYDINLILDLFSEITLSDQTTPSLQKILKDFIDKNIQEDFGVDLNKVRKLIENIIELNIFDAMYILFEYSHKLNQNPPPITSGFIDIIAHVAQLRLKVDWKLKSKFVLFMPNPYVDPNLPSNQQVNMYERESGLYFFKSDTEFYFDGYIKAFTQRLQDIQFNAKNIYIKNYTSQTPLSDSDKEIYDNYKNYEKEQIKMLEWIIDKWEKKQSPSYYTKYLSKNLLFKNNPYYCIIPPLDRPLPFPRDVYNPGTSYARYMNPNTKTGAETLLREFIEDGKVYAFTEHSDLLKSLFRKLAAKENATFDDFTKLELSNLLIQFFDKDANPKEEIALLGRKNNLITELNKYGMYDSIDRKNYILFLEEGMVETKGDGDCLFTSIIGLILANYNTNNLKLTSKKLRLMIVEVMRRMLDKGDVNPQIFLDSARGSTEIDFETVDEYLNYMKESGVWAGELEIRAASVLLNRDIIIKNESNNSSFIFKPNSVLNTVTENINPLIIYHVTLGNKSKYGNHYQYNGYGPENEVLNSLFYQIYDMVTPSKKKLFVPVQTDDFVDTYEEFFIDYIDTNVKIGKKLKDLFDTKLNNKIIVSHKILSKLNVSDLKDFCDIYNLEECFKGQKLKDDKVKNILNLLRQKYNIQGERTQVVQQETVQTVRRSPRNR